MESKMKVKLVRHSEEQIQFSINNIMEHMFLSLGNYAILQALRIKLAQTQTLTSSSTQSALTFNMLSKITPL